MAFPSSTTHRLVTVPDGRSPVTGTEMFATATVPNAFADEYEARRRRFEFLFPREPSRHATYSLKRPDLLELRWSVWNHLTLRTLAYGQTAAEAVDAALAVVKSEVDASIGWKNDELFAQVEEAPVSTSTGGAT